MAILEDISYTLDQVNLANQNKLNQHFNLQNKNLWLFSDNDAALRLRYATIQNASIENAQEKNSLDLTNVYNPNTGGVTISWFQNNNGGVQGKEQSSGNWEVNAEQTNISVKDRQQDYNVASTVPNVRLSSPFIWTGDNNRCCGFNYIPPNNSIVLTGNKEFNQPVILGYVPSNPAALYPILKPGEISISGYGNNFIHWGQSDKISIYCKSVAGEVDIDDPDYVKTGTGKLNLANCELEININSNNRFIEIKASEEPGNTSTVDINKNSFNEQPLNGDQFTKILITPTDIEIITMDDDNNESYINISSDKITQYVKQLDTITETSTTKEGINYKITKADSFFDEHPLTNEGNINFNKIDGNIVDNENKSNYYITPANMEVNIKDVDNETYYKLDSENVKIKTKHYEVEAEDIKITSTENLNLWSDDTMNIAVPSGDKIITRTNIDGKTITINAEHDSENEHEENPKTHDKYKFSLDISGCNINITGNDSDIHGTVISADDVG